MVKAAAWTTATVAAVGLTVWLVWLFVSNPTVTVYTPRLPGSSAQCHSLAAVAAGHDSGDAIVAGYIDEYRDVRFTMPGANCPPGFEG